MYANLLLYLEFNTDGDVTGPRRQGESIKRFVERIKSRMMRISLMVFYVAVLETEDGGQIVKQ